jgi:hypothetical protein
VPWIAGQLPAPPAAQKWLPGVAPVETGTVAFRRFDGTVWVDHTAVPKVWDGAGWLTRQPKRWNGAAWVVL